MCVGFWDDNILGLMNSCGNYDGVVVRSRSCIVCHVFYILSYCCEVKHGEVVN